MIDHLGFGVSDVGASKRFFAAALAPLGISIVMDGEHGVGLGKNGKPELWLAPGEARPRPVHIAFTAASRADVDGFYTRRARRGRQGQWRTGLAPELPSQLLRRVRLGPDGHNVEAVCHKAEG